MILRRNLALFILFVVVSKFSFAVVPQRAGWWKFDNQLNITTPEPGYGQSLVLVGSQRYTNGPGTDNGAVVIGPGSYYKMYHDMASNGGGQFLNEYTLQFDFRISSNSVWHNFFQTSPENANDGDFFINPAGNIGVAATGYSDYSIIPGEWYRLVISVKNGDHFTGYLDGTPFLSGVIQETDGRFSLENPLLVFADDNGEDGEIYCAELSLWNVALNNEQVKELGGFGHEIPSFVMMRVPFLQDEGTHSMTVCWHDLPDAPAKVEYGKDSLLGSFTIGTSEIISDPYYWHTVRLDGLDSDCKYYYRVGDGNTFSPIYAFKTLPERSDSGMLRFLILGDTHASDTIAVSRVIHAARQVIMKRYGTDMGTQINGIFHTGDVVVSGNVLQQYTSQFFRPLSLLSPYFPLMAVAGNHEGESSYFYSYMKLDDRSAFPQNPDLNEKVWSLKAGDALFIGLNSNITEKYGSQEIAWLDQRLSEAENDSNTDFVFLFMHHFPYSELWNINETGIEWVKNSVLPVLKKYDKVRQLHFGHTHAYERGSVMSAGEGGDFLTICGGGGGGWLDSWNSEDNHDYRDVHISLSEHFFQLLEINMSDHSYRDMMFGVGDEYHPTNPVMHDMVYHSVNQPAPETPTVHAVSVFGDSILISASEFSGEDSLMSVELKVVFSGQTLIDSLFHWEDIYGVNTLNQPVNRNRPIDLSRLMLSRNIFASGHSYSISIRYRDHNLKWSKWSPVFEFTLTGISKESTTPITYILDQNFPNPFSSGTTIPFYLPERTMVKIQISDMENRVVSVIDMGTRDKGRYECHIDNGEIADGLYSYQLITPKSCLSKKMIRVR